MVDGEGDIHNGGQEGTPAKDFEQKAVGIYRKIVDTAITGSHDSHIWIQTPHSGNVDYPEENWRISVGLNENVSDDRRKEYFLNTFTPEEFDRGIITIGQYHTQSPQGDVRSGQRTTTWAVRAENGYRAVNVKSMGAGQAPIITNVNLSDRVLDAIDRVTSLITVPAEILDGFGSYSEFYRNALNGLKEEKPISGVITPDIKGLNVFGGPSGYLLPDYVKTVEVQRREAGN